jgi:hypothetical protein
MRWTNKPLPIGVDVFFIVVVCACVVVLVVDWQGKSVTCIHFYFINIYVGINNFKSGTF